MSSCSVTTSGRISTRVRGGTSPEGRTQAIGGHPQARREGNWRCRNGTASFGVHPGVRGSTHFVRAYKV